MRIEIATLFPDMCETVLSESIIGRARRAGKLDIHCRNIRDYTLDKHRRVDDTPMAAARECSCRQSPSIAVMRRCVRTSTPVPM